MSSTTNPFSKPLAGSRRPNPLSVGRDYEPAIINGQPIVSHLDHLVLTVADIDASVEFYTKVLGMKKEVFGPKDKPRVALKFGNQKINLQHELAKTDIIAAEATKGSADLCFVTERPIVDVLAHLHALDSGHWESSHFNKNYFATQKEIEETLLEPCIRTGAQGLMRSIYLRDPDGNLIEISNYEEDLELST